MRTINPRAPRLIDAYIASAPEFARPICKKIREVIHRADPDLVEDWKWGPNFNKNGMVCGLGAFKAHVSLAFFKGALLKDPKKLLEDCSGSNAHNRTMKFSSIGDVDEKALAAYVKEAAALNEKGVQAAARRDTLALPADLKKALAANARARMVFDTFTPGYRREYIEWVVAAKRPETRTDRIVKAVTQCAEGKTLHWKYK